MKYTKPPLTFEQQADQLIQRGMTGDRDLMISRLQAVSYYRLSGYWYPFRQLAPDGSGQLLDDFRPDTTFDTVWGRYAFDRRLRLLVLDAIERIEIAVRSQIAYDHAHLYGPFAYATDPTSLPACRKYHRNKLLETVRTETRRSKDAFVKHFKSKYGDEHNDLPVWMAVEIMPFGSVLTLYRGSPPDLRRDLARPFNVHDTVFDSWLLALNTVRNICAHHGRLWNRELGTKPKIPAKAPAWNKPVKVGGHRVFGVLTLCKWCLDRIAPQSGWTDRLVALLDEFPGVPQGSMGFPDNWRDCPIWNGSPRASKGGKS